MSWNEIAKGLTGITVISGVLAGVAKVISKDEKTIAKGAFNLIFLATAVKILASACKDISQLSWGELGKGLTGVGVLMAEIALFLNTAKFSGKAVSTATGILVLSAAIKVLASACKDFGSMQWSEIGKGLTSIGILLAEIATFTNLTGNAKHVISTGIALIAIAGAMKIMASAVEDFGSMQWDEIGRGLTVMAGALAEITLAVNLMPKNMVSTGVGLIAVAGALTILSNVLSTMGNFTWEEIAKGLVTMGGALAELSIALNLMNGTLAGSAALLIASASLAVLAPVLRYTWRYELGSNSQRFGFFSRSICNYRCSWRCIITDYSKYFSISRGIYAYRCRGCCDRSRFISCWTWTTGTLLLDLLR